MKWDLSVSGVRTGVCLPIPLPTVFGPSSRKGVQLPCCQQPHDLPSVETSPNWDWPGHRLVLLSGWMPWFGLILVSVVL
jgi:hypothetical protein